MCRFLRYKKVCESVKVYKVKKSIKSIKWKVFEDLKICKSVNLSICQCDFAASFLTAHC